MSERKYLTAEEVSERYRGEIRVGNAPKLARCVSVLAL